MITYETILNELSPKINTFSSQMNIMLMSSKFTHFTEIFDNNFYRYGIQTMSNSKNVSLKNSINYCLDSSVELPNLQSSDLWEISNSIHINILIFDFKNNKIFATYYGDFFNPWRPTIYLANYDDMWEPIVSNESKVFSISSYKSNILKKKILILDINKYNSTDKITINDNFNEILELEQLINTNDTFINNTTFSKNKLEKMKKDELLQIISNMNINTPLTKLTKKDLIKIICKE